MRIVVTGGRGAVGRRVVPALVGVGHDVAVLDLTEPASPERPPDPLPASVEYRWGDVTDPAVTLDVVADADAVAHLVRPADRWEGFAAARDAVLKHSLGTATLLNALHVSGFQGRLLLAGSASAYGEGARSCPQCGPVLPDDRRASDLEEGLYDPSCPICAAPLGPLPLDETAVIRPIGLRGTLARFDEELARVFGSHQGVAVGVLRLPLVYGPDVRSGVIAALAAEARAGCSPQVLEDGLQQRDLVHVDDVARAVLLALTTATPVDGPVNVAAPRPVTLLHAADRLVSGGPAPEAVGGWRPGDARHRVLDGTLAADRLGFRAAIDPDTGLGALASGA